MQTASSELKKYLIDTRLVSKTDVDTLWQESGEDDKKFLDSLISHGKISEDDMSRAKAYMLGIPYIDLKKYKIDRTVLTLIPEPIARRHNIIAYAQSEAGLEVAMLDPEDLQAIDFIRKGVGVKVLPRLTDTASIKQALVFYQKSLKAEFGDIFQTEASKITTIDKQESGNITESDLKKLAEDLPVIKIVDTLLAHAVSQKASDVHIEPFEKDLIIRYRIDGLLHDAMILPKSAASGVTARIKVLANLRLDEKRLPQDGRFKTDLSGQAVSLRVSTLPTYFGEKIVMRLLPDTVRGLSLEAGGFHGEGLERLHRALRATTGMILVTGPTGSGKSTTLYTMLQMLNTPDVNISTIEDPIEYQIPRINQTQVKPDIGLSFSNGLRSLVRQDPDVIMVGEIRDGETASLAINASLTGHLVLSTLHTNSAAGTIPRLFDMGAEPFLVVSTINIIIAQRLVRRLTETKESYKPSAAEWKDLGSRVNLDRVLATLKEEKIVPEAATWDTISLYRPKTDADHDGYSGRIGIHEVLPMSSAIKDLVMQGKTAEAIETQATSEGMLTMLEDGVFKAVQGLTTLEEVLRVVSE